MYKRVKDKTDLLAMLKLPIVGKQYLHVYVWKTNEAMRLNYDFDGGFAAAYCGMTVKEMVPSRELIIGNKWGEIHLVQGEFGVGVFAHELQHFIIDWIDVYGCEFVSEQIEEICLIVGDMTRKFWVWFFANGMDKGNVTD